MQTDEIVKISASPTTVDEQFVTMVADLGSTKEMLANGDDLRKCFAHVIREARRLCDLPALE